SRDEREPQADRGQAMTVRTISGLLLLTAALSPQQGVDPDEFLKLEPVLQAAIAKAAPYVGTIETCGGPPPAHRRDKPPDQRAHGPGRRQADRPDRAARAAGAQAPAAGQAARPQGAQASGAEEATVDPARLPAGPGPHQRRRAHQRRLDPAVPLRAGHPSDHD